MRTFSTHIDRHTLTFSLVGTFEAFDKLVLPSAGIQPTFFQFMSNLAIGQSFNGAHVEESIATKENTRGQMIVSTSAPSPISVGFLLARKFRFQESIQRAGNSEWLECIPKKVWQVCSKHKTLLFVKYVSLGINKKRAINS